MFDARPDLRKYPVVPCLYCQSRRTWRKNKYTTHCRDCGRKSKRDDPHGPEPNEGNAVWKALANDNGRYSEEWGDVDTLEQQRELLFACDGWNAPAAHARRPACKEKECGRNVIGHSYYHNANGVTCERCLKRKAKIG